MIRLITLLCLLNVFSASAGTWMQRPSFGGVGRHRATGVAIFNKGYMGLGHVNGTGIDISYKDWWEYDPASASWTQKADFPVADHGALAFSIGKKGYVGGGSALNGEFWCYDPQLNTWTPITSCPLSPGDTQAFTVGSKGYVYAGNQIAEYDPLTNAWVMKANLPFTAFSWCCAFSVGSSGFVKSGASFYEFKPSQNLWIPRAAFPGTMSNGSSAFTLEDKGYITCGFSGSLSNVVDEVWSFNPANNTWTNEGEFPGTSRRFPVAFAIGNKGYFGTGTNGINFNDFWEFDTRNLGLEDLEVNMEVYPNPVVDQIHVRVDEATYMALEQPEVVLRNISGQLVRKEAMKTGSLTIERENLASGTYFLSLQSGNQTRISKTIILN